MTKEPWAYQNGTGLIVEEFLRLRHSMIPYLYSAAYDTHKSGIALVEPLYYRNKNKEAYTYPNEYYFGSELLVVPITQRMGSDSYARVNAWLPEGIWTDIFTGDRYEIEKGGAKKTLYRTLDSIPVLAKAGAILPFSGDSGNGCGNPERLNVWIYSGNGSYTLYEDDGNKTCFTEFIASHCTGVQAVKIRVKGDKSVIPESRIMTLYFKDIVEGTVTLLRNGKHEHTTELYENCVTVQFDFSGNNEYEIKAEYHETTALEKCKERAKRILTLAEGANEDKEMFYKRLNMCNSEDEFSNMVRKIDLAEDIKNYLLEVM